MKIIELNIIEFGGLTDRHFTLGDGLNIIEGDNETGKSTLWLFIKFMLYGMPKRGNAERERSINRLSHRAAGSMVVLHGDRKYRIERSFSENARGKVTVHDIDSGEQVFAGQEPGEAMLGVPRDIFENSCGIGQSSCAALGGEKGAAAIRNLLSSADESVDVGKIGKKLDGIRVYYRHKNGKGGRLYDLAEEISGLERRLDSATSGRLRIINIEDKLKRNAKDMEDNEAKLRGVRTIVEQAQKTELIRRFDKLSENKKSYSELEAERDTLKGGAIRTGYTPVYTDVAQLTMFADSIERAEAALRDLDGRIAALESDLPYDDEDAEEGERIAALGGAEAVINTVKGLKTKMTLGGVLFGIGIGLLTFGVLSICTKFALALGITMTVLGILTLVAGIVIAATVRAGEYRGYLGAGEDETIRQCAKAYGDKQTYEKTVADLKYKRESDGEHLSRLRSDLERAIKKTAPESEVTADTARAEAKRLKSFLDRHTEITRDMDRLHAVIENDGKILSAYDEAELRASLDGAYLNMTESDVKDAEFKKRFYEEQIRALRQKDQDLRTELINLKATAEDPTKLSDRLAEVRARYEAAELYYEALVTAIDGIERAAAALQGNITPLIGKNAGKMVEYISDGRYSSVNMGRDMEVSLVDGKGLTTTGDMMSGGTRDASYLALRISVMMQIFGGKLPPLMMDETLCQLDGTRMKRILGLLGKLCDGGLQCLLFTCHDREAIAVSDMGISANVVKM